MQNEKEKEKSIQFSLCATHSEQELQNAIQKKSPKSARFSKITRKSLDARDKGNIRYNYTVAYSKHPFTDTEEIERLPKEKLPQHPVVVVGSGPAGLFCALRLIERGILPIVIERGAPVDEREKAIQTFAEQRILNENTNVQFGEGGAGTFSDGKLNTQTHSPLHSKVLKTFVDFGAPEEILCLNKPHIGSDNLKKVVKNMREHILNAGGKVYFHTRLENVKTSRGGVQELLLRNVKTNQTTSLTAQAVVLAIGHSARDTFSWLYTQGVKMTAKDFAVGVRIEHLQKDISQAQYGDSYFKLPPADYKLVSHASERAVFSFCMCPGGYVMPSASEFGGVVTNGMSNYKRDGENANSALIVQVRKTDFESEHALAGVQFQREIEKRAFQEGGGDYRAPAQRVGDFLNGVASSGFGKVTPTYGCAVTPSDMRAVLPDFLVQPLKSAIVDMDKRLRGFACADAVLTGAETRTSSPIRMERDSQTLQSVTHENLYPCGEGAGYAGGISSSAADGLRVADAIYQRFIQN